VQPFFISEEKLARQAYRYDKRYRLAAGIFFGAILLQVPFLILFYYQSRIKAEQASRSDFALQKKVEINTELGGLKKAESQLRQIQSWEPILRGRMPASAVLGAVEQAIPREVVLSKIMLEAANYRPIPLGSVFFRVPDTYTIILEGEQKPPDSGVWEKFVRNFLSRLPPGSNVVSSSVGDGGNSSPVTLSCKAVLQAKANGNYFPLGINRIDPEENL
jgi:hypothetical protein